MESEATIKIPHFYMETSPRLYISIKTTNLSQILVGQWLARYILENKRLDQENLTPYKLYLQPYGQSGITETRSYMKVNALIPLR